MNLELDQDQRDLVVVANDVCSELSGRWRAGGVDDQIQSLKVLADVGILGVRHPEPEGAGLGPVEAALTSQACGSALAPAALLLWSDLVGVAVPGVLAGAVSVSGTYLDSRDVCFGGSTSLTVIVGEDGARVFESDAVRWEGLPQIDPTTPRAVICGIPPASGELIADKNEIARWRWQSYVLMAAHLVGVGAGAVQTSVEYAKERHQFGRAIGSFQAVKHLLADAYTAVEMARCQTLVAALSWAEHAPNAPDQALAAAVVATRAAIAAAETAIQVHGGMGFTAEALPHLYYKRALLLQNELRIAGLSPRQLSHRRVALHTTAP